MEAPTVCKLCFDILPALKDGACRALGQDDYAHASKRTRAPTPGPPACMQENLCWKICW